MRADERVAVLTALQKMVRTALDEARAEADAELMAAYEDYGVTRKALRLGGEKVGDFVVAMAPEAWEVTDADAFEDFALSYGFGEPQRDIRPEYRARAVEIVREELPEAVETRVRLDPDWRRLVTNTCGMATYLDTGLPVPGLRYAGPRPKGTQVRGCRPQDVAPVLSALGGVDALLLGGAGEEGA